MSAISFYIGSYTIPSPWTVTPNAHGAGITYAELDLRSGSISLGPSMKELNPSFLARDHQRRLLWAISEPEFGGELICYHELINGRLALAGRLATGADAPCHITVDRYSRMGFVSHFHGSRVALLSLGDSGEPTAVLSLAEPPGLAPGYDRALQKSRPHATLRLDDDELLVADTGRDVVALYRLPSFPEVSLKLLDALPLPSGTGPRHLARRAGTNFVYVSNQNTGGITLIERSKGGDGPRLGASGSISASGLGRRRCVPSEVALHPIFDVAYLANRQDDSLTIFDVEPATGELTLIGSVDVLGQNPRHFAVSPDGGFLVVSNQDSDNLAVFKLQNKGRQASWIGEQVEVPTPTAVCF